jgi:hypothetical protein
VKRPRGRDPIEALEASRAKVPFAWVLDELDPLDPVTRPLFGCVAVYAGERILFALRDKPPREDSGVWVATTREHHEGLRRELPSLRSIGVLGDGVTGWQIIPADGDGFEDEVLRACALARAGDARIGKVPEKKGAKKRSAKKKIAPAKKAVPKKRTGA